MQEKIDNFNRAFIRLATDYAETLDAKIRMNATYTTEPTAAPWCWGSALADEVRVANLLAATVGKMQSASGRNLAAEEPGTETPQDKPEPATLGPRMVFQNGRAHVQDAPKVAAGTDTFRATEEAAQNAWEAVRDILAGKRPAPDGAIFNVTVDISGNPTSIDPELELGTARALKIKMPNGGEMTLWSVAEAYKLTGCIQEMASRVWPWPQEAD